MAAQIASQPFQALLRLPDLSVPRTVVVNHEIAAKIIFNRAHRIPIAGFSFFLAFLSISAPLRVAVLLVAEGDHSVDRYGSAGGSA